MYMGVECEHSLNVEYFPLCAFLLSTHALPTKLVTIVGPRLTSLA